MPRNLSDCTPPLLTVLMWCACSGDPSAKEEVDSRGSAATDYPRGFDGDVGNRADTGNPNIAGGAYLTVEDYSDVKVAMRKRQWM